MNLYARGTRNNPRRMVCGVVDCGEHLADYDETGMSRYFRLVPGLVVGDDGIVTLSKHANWRRRHGLNVANRRAVESIGRAIDDERYVPYYTDAHVTVTGRILVRCHGCGSVQWLDVERTRST